MKKRFSEEQIIGFLREPEAEAGLPVKELCRRRGFSEGGLTPDAYATKLAQIEYPNAGL